MVSFVVYFRRIVEKWSCFLMNDRRRSPVFFHNASGNGDAPHLLCINRSGKSLCLCGYAVCLGWGVTCWDLLKRLPTLTVVKNCKKSSIFNAFSHLCSMRLIVGSISMTVYRWRSLPSFGSKFGFFGSNEVRFSRRRRHSIQTWPHNLFISYLFPL